MALRCIAMQSSVRPVVVCCSCSCAMKMLSFRRKVLSMGLTEVRFCMLNHFSQRKSCNIDILALQLAARPLSRTSRIAWAGRSTKLALPVSSRVQPVFAASVSPLILTCLIKLGCYCETSTDQELDNFIRAKNASNSADFVITCV